MKFVLLILLGCLWSVRLADGRPWLFAQIRALGPSKIVQILDLSRFDAAPLIAFNATKETNYGNE
ncbi:hypothetical protein, partial [Epibacterium ulvae]|uniref:hypothetical protein n=1 Tax=Epibacterium ulvae TaxID=1156985 RepID=UPI003CD0D620